MTPAEFVPWIEARIKERKDQRMMENFRAGTICAAIYNLRRNAEVCPEPFEPWNFINCGDLAPVEVEEPEECPADRIVRKMRGRIQRQEGTHGT